MPTAAVVAAPVTFFADAFFDYANLARLGWSVAPVRAPGLWRASD